MITKITHFTLYVSDQNKALEFYTQKLGFKVHTDATFGDMRWLTLHPANQPDFELVLMKPETDAEKALVGKQGGKDKPLFTVESTDCTKDYEFLKSQGVKMLEEVAHQPWGIATSFADPDGNIVYICQPLS